MAISIYNSIVFVKDLFTFVDAIVSVVCQPNCRGARGHCRSCSHPYTNAPFCCDCLPPYVKKNGEDGVCVCPDGYYDVGGTCERE